MNTFISVLTHSIVATSVINSYETVGFDNAAVTAADAPVKGIAMNPAEVGDATAAMLIGICRVKGTGVIAAGDTLVSSATGGVQKAAADPANPIATALTSAADGEFVEILIR